jgi:hypothetical protein
MALEAVFVVGLLVLGALFALAVEVVRLRGRARRLEEGAATQAHVLAAVQSRLAELGREEQTRPEGIPALLATPEGQLAQQLAQGGKPAAPAEGEQTESERPTALPTTPGDVADDSELVAATVAGDADADVDDAAVTRVLLKAEMQAALGAGAGGATRPPQTTPRGAVPYVSKTLLSMPAQGAAATSSPSDSAASPPRPEDTRPTFESLPLFDPEHSNAPRVEQEAAE